MASKRVAQTAVNWKAFTERVPPNQREYFRLFKAKNDIFVNRVDNLPAALPNIDFAFYKNRLSSSAMVDQFEKAYSGMAVPYPTDKDKILAVIDQEEQQAAVETKEYVENLKKEIGESKAMIKAIDSLPPPNEMTLEMHSYYFPGQAPNPDKPTFWPHTPQWQPSDPEYAKHFINYQNDFRLGEFLKSKFGKYLK
ncbi:hypothetical protein CHS0354_005651 [Potamilus streckersoni]|uniref:ATP synthase subunit d, mitochondrial n=1 Tax=Potamilus streckersoni TaxID=2493646 RepID=A0AAE0S0N3_9BIVA|nr:hypothetical protein CHS0354_005651 [Potamilus streckersoni]